MYFVYKVFLLLTDLREMKRAIEVQVDGHTMYKGVISITNNSTKKSGGNKIIMEQHFYTLF